MLELNNSTIEKVCEREEQAGQSVEHDLVDKGLTLWVK